MIQQSELIMLLLGLAVLVLIISNFSRLKQIPKSTLILASYLILLAGWGFTVLEGFLLPNLLNMLEHLCYAASSITFLAWIWKVLKP